MSLDKPGPGGQPQTPFQKDQPLLLVNTGSLKKRQAVQRLHKLGYKLVVLHPEKNWAQPYVQDWILADTNDHEASLAAVQSYVDAKGAAFFGGVLTFWEDDVLLTSKIVDKLGLIGTPHKVATLARNKFAFRKFCQENGIRTPQFFLLKEPADIQRAAKQLPFPLVVKPAFGASSAYVVKVRDEEELKEATEYIWKHLSTEVESALHNGKVVFAEEYIDGDEVDIDILLQNGKVKFASVTDNAQTEEPYFVETGWTMPSVLPKDDQEALIALAEETLEKLGVRDGCVHFEAKLSSQGPVPIEVNLRMGGDGTDRLIRKVWRVDLVDESAKIALGIYLAPHVLPEEPFIYNVGKYFLPQRSGILSSVRVPERFAPELRVSNCEFYKQTGDRVQTPPLGYEYLGWLSTDGENANDARDNNEQAFRLVNFDVVPFNSTSSVGKTSRLSPSSPATMFGNTPSRIERLRLLPLGQQRTLHIGIACNRYSSDNGTVEESLTVVGDEIAQVLRQRGYKVSFFDFNNVGKVVDELQQSQVDLVFNVCERINGSSLLEPHAAAILDALQIPYTGSNPFTLGLAIDKIRVKKMLSYHNIPTPKWDYAYSVDEDLRDDWHYPLIVKPANSDNSIGVTNDSVVTDEKALRKQMKFVIEELGRPALIEEYIEGDEYDVSILGSERETLQVLPLSRSIFTDLPEGLWHIYPFEAKFGNTPENPTLYKQKIRVERPPKKMSKKLASLISEIALDTYTILDCHDYGRVEIKIDKDNNPFVLELNPNPSIGRGDCVPDVAEITGLDYGDFLEEIIGLAIARYQNRPPYYHLQPNLL